MSTTSQLYRDGNAAVVRGVHGVDRDRQTVSSERRGRGRKVGSIVSSQVLVLNLGLGLGLVNIDSLSLLGDDHHFFSCSLRWLKKQAKRVGRPDIYKLTARTAPKPTASLAVPAPPPTQASGQAKSVSNKNKTDATVKKDGAVSVRCCAFR